MGIAEIIPGVSGGTIAFISGIYERLITAISNFDKTSVSFLLKGEYRTFWNRIDGYFLFNLIIGMVVGIVVGALTVTHLLEHYPPVIWSFFFGLILGSIVYVARKIKVRNVSAFIVFMVGALIAYGIVNSPAGDGNTAMWFVFLSGMLAISALVLPGISGSFILLLLGMYFYIINDTLKALLHGFSMDKMMVLLIFGAGCIVGLMSVVKLLKWAFEKYPNTVLALLTGFMLGSLPKIWPWKNTTSFLNKTDGHIYSGAPEVWSENIKRISEQMVIPSQYAEGNPYLIVSIVMAILGVASVIMLARLEKPDVNS